MRAAAPLPRVVILGGGFAGLYTARALARARAEVTVVDRRNHHLFQPLLYQVATAALNPSDIAAPIRGVLRRQKNARVLLAEATRIDLAGRNVILDDGELAFDVLVIATGATHSYFGHDEWAEHAPGLKSIEDALDMRRRILLAYEEAERTGDPVAQQECLTFVVVGAGPTGVELAGALTEIGRHAMDSNFRTIDPAQVRVVLVEGAPRVLTAYPPDLSGKALEQLESLGVDVRTGLTVVDVDARGVTLSDGSRVAARTVLWGAGVQASPLAATLGVALDRAGRVIVEPDLTVPGHPEVFVIGDLAHVEKDGKEVPGVAPAAIQEGRHTARNILRLLSGRTSEPFEYTDKGSLATIGRAAAIADLGAVKLSGTLAWLAWLAIHIFFLIGFRNRFLVIFQWAWAYLTYQRGARLITGDIPTFRQHHPGQRPPP
jgi:NADH dehydrogenase